MKELSLCKSFLIMQNAKKTPHNESSFMCEMEIIEYELRSGHKFMALKGIGIWSVEEGNWSMEGTNTHNIQIQGNLPVA